MDDNLRAGIAIYNAGEYHAAHDAWEEYWLGLDEGTEDELFFHGLIQFTAAVYHSRTRNWGGATGLAESAGEYLSALSGTYRAVNVGQVRAYLTRLGNDPALVERRQPLALTYEGTELTVEDLRFEATAIAAEILAEEYGYNEALIAQAAEFARADLADEQTGSPFVTLLFDFVREPPQRAIVTQRLSEHTQRRESRVEDVTGLFDERDE